MNERTHHKYSFSKWPAFKICGHYESDERESEEAKSGTAKHLDFEECINEVNTGVPAMHESEGARWAANYLKSIAGNREINTETQVVIPAGMVCEGISGYCDAWFIKDNELYVIDFKSGALGSIDYMPQVMGYALALASYNESVKSNPIHCILLFGASKEVVNNTYSYSKLVENAAEITINLNSKDNKPCANGMCKYCKHSKECEAMAGNIIKFKDNALTNMSNASLYDWCVSAKSAIEKWMDDIKQIAINNGGVLDDGKVRYEIKTDKRGRMTSVNVAQLWYDMSDKGCSITQEQLMKACTISKKAFTDLYKADAKSNGMLVKDIESKYSERCTYGEPASKLIKVERK